MADEKYTFEQARIRLEEIALEVRKKDTSLEKSLDLLEEGVRLANICTELVDHTDMSASVPVPEIGEAADEPGAEPEAVQGPEDAEVDAVDTVGVDEVAVADETPDAGSAASEADDTELDIDGFDDIAEPESLPADEDADD
ncbi:MAG: exodeoxyribonuclease VII small subunit [Coriobacteriia bacterium]|nr:exodeoxyribonuclease VII small subunit [Coriobacteriia bacterium]